MIKFQCKNYPKLLAEWRTLNHNYKPGLPHLKVSEFIYQSGLTSIKYTNSSNGYWELTEAEFAFFILKWG